MKEFKGEVVYNQEVCQFLFDQLEFAILTLLH